MEKKAHVEHRSDGSSIPIGRWNIMQWQEKA